MLSAGRASVEVGRTDKRRRKREKDYRRWQKQIASGQTVPAIVHARLQARKLRDDVKVRLAAIRLEVLGETPHFYGTLTTDRDVANLSDRQMLKSMAEDGHGCVADGSALVYWTDGAVLNLKPSATGEAVYHGAGVVEVTKHPQTKAVHYISKEVSAGCDTGNIGDAEIYAVSVDIQIAIQDIKNGSGRVRRVRGVTDCRPILDSMPAGNSALGPFISSRVALQDLYEGAAWLKSKEIRFELVWVKGHRKSEGNRVANRAAHRAASLASAAEAKETRGIKTEAPAMFVQKGRAWRDEWLWRANKSFLIKSSKATGGTQAKREWSETGERCDQVGNVEQDTKTVLEEFSEP
ncbi:hypothetical protein FB567DRAFT_114068 [Paraphoma chrysanthemicola]|uniref:RNase H type-1 domain-containing protein n=1 Tax=Paraphoma chrysanthemicola TaxID=798071 RepID=A0A8K0VVI4_9PLEO|nr:hypothetical protein FB567DRAFT_114068 [Paraphoma chrysanthemicola]